MTEKEFQDYVSKHSLTAFDLHKIFKGLKQEILNDQSWRLYSPDLNLKDGMYLTIRAGLGGHIYTMENQIINNVWNIGVADGSHTIYYKEMTEEMLDSINLESH